MIYKSLHRKLKIVQHEPHRNPGESSSAQGGLAAPAQHVTLVVFSHVISHE